MNTAPQPLPAQSAKLTLLAGITLTTVLGSIHAFSVFLQPLEQLLGENRAQVSLIYSGALICLTISVLFGHRIYAHWAPSTLSLVACVAAAAGISLASVSDNYWLTVVGYSVIFGGANGVGYGFALQISAQAMPDRKGFAMGTVTAFYALGAATAPFLFSYMLEVSGLAGAMLSAAVIFVCAGIVAAILMRVAGIAFVAEHRADAVEGSSDAATQRLLWLGYGSGALAGLMVIGHATGIVQAAGGSAALAIGGAIVISAGNMLGGLAAGVLADRIRISALLMMLPLMSAVVLAVSSGSSSPGLLLAGLVLIGFSYGAIIAVYPVAVLTIAGTGASSRVYGRVFTSWGLAGLIGPWLAGLLFDSTGTYTLAMLAAGASGALSLLIAWRLSPLLNLRQEKANEFN